MVAQRSLSVISGNNLPLIFSAVLSIGVAANWQVLSRAIGAAFGRLRLRQLVSFVNDEEDLGITLSNIFVYPVKSLRAVSLREATVDKKGLANDRRFMLIIPRPPPLAGSFGPDEATHQFVTQRQCPSLATIVANLQSDDKSLSLSSHLVPSENVTINIDESKASGKSYKCRIWNETTETVDMGDEAASFLAKIVAKDDEASGLVKDIRLVAMAKDDRFTNDKYTPRAALSWTGALPQVSLADGFPILIASQASLDELNDRLKKKGKGTIPMSRFRPNIVVTGTKPFEEDTWRVISINGVIFHLVKGCPRCKQSCTDQESGKVSEEPVQTLSEFRALGPVKENVYFAQNALAQNAGGAIRVGSSVQVLERGTPVWDSA